jgi:hypothetical protein
MIDRTLSRPREIIQFCAQTVETARERAATLPLPYAAVGWTERDPASLIEILWHVGFLTARPASGPGP